MEVDQPNVDEQPALSRVAGTLEGSAMSPFSVFFFYGLMVLVGWGWWVWRGEGSLDWVIRWQDVGLGVASGLLIVAGTRVLRHFSAAARSLELELKRALGTLKGWEIGLYAVCSGVGEEVLFRGALQAELGIFWATFIFAFLHGGFRGKLKLWSFFALLAGFVFGGMMEYTSSLVAPIIAHATVNGINLHALNRLELE